MSYVGRFAPSPTGALHFGSLLTAVASFLDAKQHNGRWLVRIEDIDPPREPKGSSEQILRTLEQFHLYWDEPVLYQSTRHEAYAHALQQLKNKQHLFPCCCPRKSLIKGIHHYPCPTPATAHDSAWRFLCPDKQMCLNDELQGKQCYQLTKDIGDFVLLRRDGLWAYQLAVVVDDEFQGITHIVRGTDLLDSSIRQQLIINALNFTPIHYKHVPVATAQTGHKLSKQTGAKHIHTTQPNHVLWQILHWLKQAPPTELKIANLDDLLAWGITHWDSSKLQKTQSMLAPRAYL